MAEQIALYAVTEKPKPKIDDKKKRNWENGFQRWSDREFQNGSTAYGSCGYGSMCDYCEDNSYGRPCVRALNEMCREKGVTIDYDNRNYEAVWDGERREDG